MKPNCCRMPTTSRPDNLRSLGMSRVGLEGDEKRRMITKAERRGEFPFQVKPDCFAEVDYRFVEGAALRDNRNFNAFRHVAGLIPRPDHRFNGLLQMGHACTVLDFYRGCKATACTPGFIVGTELVLGAMDVKGLKELIARTGALIH